MTIEINRDDIQDLIIQGTKEAIDLEVQRLRDEGWPILIWRDGKVVDIREELDLQETGRVWLLNGVLFFLIPLLFLGVIYIDTKWLPVSVIRFTLIFTGIGCLGAFGLGAWYGGKKTRRTCLVFMAVLFPLLVYLIYSYFANGFFAN